MTNTLMAVAISRPENQSVTILVRYRFKSRNPTPATSLPAPIAQLPSAVPDTSPPKPSAQKPMTDRTRSEAKLPDNPAGMARNSPGAMNRPIRVPISA